MYQGGLGVQRDYTQAARWWAVTAHQQRSSANALADLYAAGLGVPQSWEKARLLYLESCHKGFAEACASVGYIYELGHDVPRSRSSAIRYLAQAGSLGDEQSGQVAKVLARPNTPVFRNIDDLSAYTAKIIAPSFLNGTLPDPRTPPAGSGSLDSKTASVDKHQAAGGSQSAEALWQESRQKYLNLDHAGAAVLCRKAAEAGSVVATYQMGYFYETGDGVNKDLAQAFAWYRRGAAKGDAASESALGLFYEEGTPPVGEDWKTAASYYQKSAEQGFSKGEYRLARAYRFGIGVPCDLQQAARWFEKAAQHGMLEAADEAKWLRGNRFRFDGNFRTESERSFFSGLWEGNMTVPFGRTFSNSTERTAYLKGAAQRTKQINDEARWQKYGRDKQEHDQCVQQYGSTACGAPPLRPQ
jgi:TPR repeat protein